MTMFDPMIPMQRLPAAEFVARWAAGERPAPVPAAGMAAGETVFVLGGDRVVDEDGVSRTRDRVMVCRSLGGGWFECGGRVARPPGRGAEVYLTPAAAQFALSHVAVSWDDYYKQACLAR